jgi:dihydrofolate synthase/folylpolyglutamate synthase
MPIARSCSAIDLDHQAILGTDRESIGFEKAGIFRDGTPAIFGDRDPPKRLVDHARASAPTCRCSGEDFRFEAAERQWDFLGRRGAKRALPIRRCAAAGSSRTPPAPSPRWTSSPIACRLAGRGQARAHPRAPRGPPAGPARRPAVVLDVAHNPHAARALADGLGDMGFHENTLGVFAISATRTSRAWSTR